jgi:hypothetical protein
MLIDEVYEEDYGHFYDVDNDAIILNVINNKKEMYEYNDIIKYNKNAPIPPDNDDNFFHKIIICFNIISSVVLLYQLWRL